MKNRSDRLHRDQNTMKIFVYRVSGSYEVPNTETRMAIANSYAEILYEVAEAVSGLAVHTAVYAPG